MLQILWNVDKIDDVAVSLPVHSSMLGRMELAVHIEPGGKVPSVVLFALTSSFSKSQWPWLW